jgi:hypothetical protein
MKENYLEAQQHRLNELLEQHQYELFFVEFGHQAEEQENIYEELCLQKKILEELLQHEHKHSILKLKYLLKKIIFFIAISFCLLFWFSFLGGNFKF